MHIRKMVMDDLAPAYELSVLAGWNQTPADWRRLLELQPGGCFVMADAKTIFGTVTTTQFDTIAWIGMILVHPEWRRRGIAGGLLDCAIHYLKSNGVEVIRLDATPEGKQVYLQKGFVEEYSLGRWEGIAPVEGCRCYPSIQRDQWEEISRFDADACGMERHLLLQKIEREYPGYSAVARESAIRGYALGRRGRLANYVGPCVADDPAVAGKLLFDVCAHWPGEKVFVDLIDSAPGVQTIIEKWGLMRQRSLTRMRLGNINSREQREKVYAITGPETG
jgi:GNAT superfamily N-acetyltransferase